MGEAAFGLKFHIYSNRKKAMVYLFCMPQGRKMRTLSGTSIKQHLGLLNISPMSDYLHLYWQLLYGRINNYQNNNHGQSEKESIHY